MTAVPRPDKLATPALYEGLLWRRPAAYLVDLVILGIIVAVLWVLFFFLGIVTLGLAWLLIPGALFSLPVVAIAYHALLVGGSRAATFGMRLADLEVRTVEGGRPSVLQAALQSLLFYATVPPTGSLILLVGLLNARWRLVHDFLSGTVVVRAGEAGPLP
jgi:uncharacterized RDD family membrane protein YckC